MIEELERDLQTLKSFAEQHEDIGAREAVDRILSHLQPQEMVTTTEAARLLGIRSINTVKALVIGQRIPHSKAGNRMMIPLCEITKLQDSQWVRYFQESERAHEEMGGEPMTQEEMDILSESRPGTLPWKRT